MDYERKYKELVANIKKAHLFAQTDSTKNVLEDILPELVESEDERIRKWLVDYVKRETGFTGYPSQGQVLAWLEKQKSEKLLIPEKKNDVRKAIEEVIRVYGKTQGEWIAGYDMDTLVVHLRNAFAALEKQKEQKPVEIHVDNPNIQKLDPNVVVETRTDGTGELDGKALLYTADKSYKIGFRDGVASVKPVEWSEEDEKMLSNLIGHLEVAYSPCDWLTETVAWLKSLRPQPHWKPSETEWIITEGEIADFVDGIISNIEFPIDADLTKGDKVIIKVKKKL